MVKKSIPRLIHWRIAAIIIIAALGVYGAILVGRREDKRIRRELLAEAQMIVESLDVGKIKALTFTPEDLELPEFNLLTEHLRAYGKARDLRIIYTAARIEGQLLFGPESITPDDPIATPPGTVYEQPPAELIRVFRESRGFTAGPFSDEFGSFVSAFAPLRDGQSGDVMLAVCIDIPVEMWKASISRSRRFPLAFVIAFSLVFLAGHIALEIRGNTPKDYQGVFLYIEAILLGALGLILAAAGAWFAHDLQNEMRRSSFASLARAKGGAVRMEINDVESLLSSVSRLFRASEYVDRWEFGEFSEPLAANQVVLGMYYIPEISADELEAIIESAHRDGLDDFTIWEWSEEGLKVPAAAREKHYPILYTEPIGNNIAIIGFDCGSHPELRMLLDETRKTGFPLAADPIGFGPIYGDLSQVIALKAVESRTQLGHVAVAVHMEKLLEKAIIQAIGTESGIGAALHFITHGGYPSIIASWPQTWSPDNNCGDVLQKSASVSMPVSHFGQTYAITIHPTDEWMAANPVVVGRWAAVSGLLITGLLVALTTYIINRRAFLEKEVLERTELLERSHEDYRRLIANAPDGIFVQIDWRFDYINPAARRLFGAKIQKELIGSPVMERFHTDYHDIISERITELNERRREVPLIEEVFLKMDGTPFDVEVSAVPIMRDGKPGALVFFRDITERKRAENAIRESELRFRTLADSGLALVWTSGLESKCDYFNSVWQKFTGRTLEQELGEGWTEGVHPEDFERCIETYTTAFVRRVPFRMNYRLRRHDGVYRWLLDEGAPRYDGQGNFIGYIGHCLDITDQIEAEHALAESEAQLLEAQHIARIGRWEVEYDTTKVVLSESVYYIFDLDPDITELTFEGMMNMTHPDDRDMVTDCFNTSLSNRGIFETEYRILLPTGEIKWVFGTSRHHYDNNGNLVRTVGVVQDITDRKRIEGERDALGQQLRQQQRLEVVGTLAAGIAHDFNNLLTGITGFARFALDAAPPETTTREDMQELIKLADRAADLTRQLLAFSRKQTLQVEVLDVNEMIEEIMKMLTRLIGEHIDLVFHPASDLYHVKADRGQLEQILMNLVVNARDAMPDGGKLTIETKNVELDEIYVRSHADSHPGDYVMFAVTDTGIGMDEHTRAHLFEPFFTTKGLGQGSGLGLATVYGIVKQHGGNIWVYSEEGKGSTFKIYLPRVYEQPESNSEPEIFDTEAMGSGAILIVEDDASVREIAERSLAARGYRVFTAATPEEADQILEEHGNDIDLILTDVILPERSGRQMYESAVKKFGHLRVVYMSGYTDNAIVHHGMLDPGIPFIQKPFTPDALFAKIRAALKGDCNGSR